LSAQALAAAATRSLFSPTYGRLCQLLVDGRHAQHLTQVELAQRLGRPQSFASKYELGERRLDFVEVFEIAEALQADLCNCVTELRQS
jgi:transcriptional regulator with XRE-family HTH domain